MIRIAWDSIKILKLIAAGFVIAAIVFVIVYLRDFEAQNLEGFALVFGIIISIIAISVVPFILLIIALVFYIIAKIIEKRRYVKI